MGGRLQQAKHKVYVTLLHWVKEKNQNPKPKMCSRAEPGALKTKAFETFDGMKGLPSASSAEQQR